MHGIGGCYSGGGPSEKKISQEGKSQAWRKDIFRGIWQNSSKTATAGRRAGKLKGAEPQTEVGSGSPGGGFPLAPNAKKTTHQKKKHPPKKKKTTTQKKKPKQKKKKKKKKNPPPQTPKPPTQKLTPTKHEQNPRYSRYLEDRVGRKR